MNVLFPFDTFPESIQWVAHGVYFPVCAHTRQLFHSNSNLLSQIHVQSPGASCHLIWQWASTSDCLIGSNGFHESLYRDRVTPVWTLKLSIMGENLVQIHYNRKEVWVRFNTRQGITQDVVAFSEVKKFQHPLRYCQFGKLCPVVAYLWDSKCRFSHRGWLFFCFFFFFFFLLGSLTDMPLNVCVWWNL